MNRRFARGSDSKYGRQPALKMMKRRFTQKAVAQITHSGAPPANTHSDIRTANAEPSPALDIAMPATRPHAPMPSETSRVSRAPTANSGWRQSGVEVVIAPLSQGGDGVASRVAKQCLVFDRLFRGRLVD